MRFILKSIHSPNKPLQQLINRVTEFDQSLGHCALLNEKHALHWKTFEFKLPSHIHFKDPVTCYKKLVTKQFTLKKKSLQISMCW